MAACLFSPLLWRVKLRPGNLLYHDSRWGEETGRFIWLLLQINPWLEEEEETEWPWYFQRQHSLQHSDINNSSWQNTLERHNARNIILFLFFFLNGATWQPAAGCKTQTNLSLFKWSMKQFHQFSIRAEYCIQWFGCMDAGRQQLGRISADLDRDILRLRPTRSGRGLQTGATPPRVRGEMPARCVSVLC